jgi:hypothetical protein
MNKLTPAQIVKIGALYGLYTSIAYVVYFLIMRLAGMATIVELRFLNYIFLMIAAYYASRKAEEYKKWRLKYLQAFIVIFVTGTFSFIYFSGFLLAYSLFDPIVLNTFAEIFQGSSVFGRFSAPFLIASEGISFTSIISLGMAFFVQEYSGHHRKNSGEVIGYGE